MDGQALPHSMRIPVATQRPAATAKPGTAERPVDPDAEVVARVQGGDTDAFSLLVRRHQRGIYYLCLRYLRSEQDAADLAQRVLLRAYEKLGSFRGQAAFRTWIYRIAVNLCLNAIRDAQRRATTPLDEGALGVEADQHHQAERSAQRQVLRQAVDRLPPKQRMTVILRVYQDLPFAEVAEILGSSENSAKVNYHHAMKRLRQLVAMKEASGS